MIDDFDEVKWNEERQAREVDVIIAVTELSNFMGCNSFILPNGPRKIKVVVLSEEDSALLN